MLLMDENKIFRFDTKLSHAINIKRIIENKEIIDPIDEIIFQKISKSG